VNKPENKTFRHDAPDITGVLLVNLGTPDAPDRAAVRRYLKEFLWDPRVVEMARPLWWLVLNLVILNTRPQRSAHAYAKVWTDEGSPLLVISRRQCAALQAGLQELSGTGVKVVLAMRYGKPSIAAGLDELRQAGARRLLVLPLYPQYSATTTASTFDAVTQVLRSWRWLWIGPRWRASPVVFLEPKAYTAMVKALHPEPDAFRLMHRFDNYEHVAYYAFRLHREADAAERYGHAAAYHTMLASVAAPEQWARAPHAWLLEGFAYLVTFELCGTGNLSFVSIEESNRKAKFTRPPPKQRTRAACQAWVREQVAARRAYALPDVFARSLNNLDTCASLQAYSSSRARTPSRMATGSSLTRESALAIDGFPSSIFPAAPSRFSTKTIRWSSSTTEKFTISRNYRGT